MYPAPSPALKSAASSDRANWVVLHRVDHAGETRVGDHLDVDEVSGPVATSLVVYGGVEGDGVVSEKLVRATR
jgi:hypothetical protein